MQECPGKPGVEGQEAAKWWSDSGGNQMPWTVVVLFLMFSEETITVNVGSI